MTAECVQVAYGLVRTPTLSIVLPVHQVEPYLDECLRSILDDLPDDPSTIEIVAVDDASPDRCGEILASYAAAHRALIRVVTLPTNVGLGLARNAGLDEARGDYVWFVDSDDRLPPGSIPAVLDRLVEHRPDVLLLDHLRVRDGGRGELDASSHLLRGVDGVVSLAQRPDLLRLQHTAWNKVVRRGLMNGLGLRFYPGWYEDIPFSHPVLIAAEKVALLDRVCYYYRQGRPGAITSTRSHRHFDVFAQYERLFDWVQRRNPDDGLRRELFARMVNHYLVVAGNDGRLHAHLRREFFRRISEHYRRFRPPSGVPAAGAARIKHYLVRSDNYAAYSALRKAYRIGRWLRGNGGASRGLGVPPPATNSPVEPAEPEPAGAIPARIS